MGDFLPREGVAGSVPAEPVARPDDYYDGVIDIGTLPPDPEWVLKEKAAVRAAEIAVQLAPVVSDFRRATDELHSHQEGMRTAHQQRRDIILALKAEGFSYREIADLFSLAVSTVFALAE